MGMFARLWARLFGRPETPQRVVFNGCTVQLVVGGEVEFTDDEEESEPSHEDQEQEVEMQDRSMQAIWIIRTRAELDALEQLAAESPNHVRVTSEWADLPKWWNVTVWAVNDQWFNYVQYLRFENLGKAAVVAKALGERPPAQGSPATKSSEG
jgi:hypothetical protein